MKESLYIPLGGISPNSTGSEASLSAESDSRSEFAHQIRDKVIASAYRRTEDGFSRFRAATHVPDRDSGQSGSVAFVANHPDPRHFVQTFHVIDLQIYPLFPQRKTIKVAIIRLPEVENQW